jgi:hypothetical protein
MMEFPERLIDSDLVRRLIADQFPQWTDLPVRPVARGGWNTPAETRHLSDIVESPNLGKLTEVEL